MLEAVPKQQIFTFGIYPGSPVVGMQPRPGFHFAMLFVPSVQARVAGDFTGNLQPYDKWQVLPKITQAQSIQKVIKVLVAIGPTFREMLPNSGVLLQQ